MKVSTDACIQGAWAARMLQHLQVKNILDIGTGTGLLSLMLAQAIPEAKITALEINEEACLQAKANFEQSSWVNNLAVNPMSVQQYSREENTINYDCIICNPPFFHNQLPSSDKARNQARHSPTLSKAELAEAASSLLAKEGGFCIMYPEREWNEWDKQACLYGLFPELWLYVKPFVNSAPNRVIGWYSLCESDHFRQEELIIYDAPQCYTDNFKSLMRPYYLMC